MQRLHLERRECPRLGELTTPVRWGGAIPPAGQEVSCEALRRELGKGAGQAGRPSHLP